MEPAKNVLPASFMLSDLARSCLVPEDFRVRPTELSNDKYGCAAYRIHYPESDGYYRDRIDREPTEIIKPDGEVIKLGKYKGTPYTGELPPLFYPGTKTEFETSTVRALVEGEKKGQAGYIATSIPIACIAGAWMAFVPLFPGSKVRVLHPDIIAGAVKKLSDDSVQCATYLLILDGDWAHKPEIAMAYAITARELEALGIRVIAPDLSEYGGLDDFLVARFGTLRKDAAHPDFTREQVLKALYELPQVPYRTLQLPRSYCRTTPDAASEDTSGFGDAHNASMLVRAFGRQNLKYLVDSRVWLFWEPSDITGTDTWYRPITKEPTNKMARVREAHEFLARYYSKFDEPAYKLKTRLHQIESARLTGSGPITSALRLAQDLPSIACYSSTFDQNPNILRVQNGVIDLTTGMLRAERREDMASKCCPLVYPGMRPTTESAGLMERTFKEVMSNEKYVFDEEMYNFILDTMGIALFGHNDLRYFYMLIGDGMNGKSLLLEILLATLGGDYSIALPPEYYYAGKFAKDANAPVPMQLKLRSSRVAVMSEWNPKYPVDFSKVKSDVGGDSVAGRNLYISDPRDQSNKSTLIMAANKAPRTDGADRAFWDRQILIPMRAVWNDPSRPDRNTPGRRVGDKGLKEKLIQGVGSREWLLWELVQRATKYHRTGYFHIPTLVHEASRAYEKREDIYNAWRHNAGLVLTGNTDGKNPKNRIEIDTLYQSYCAYCNSKQREPDTKHNFRSGIKSRYGLDTIKSGVHHFVGIRYLEDGEEYPE